MTTSLYLLSCVIAWFVWLKLARLAVSVRLKNSWSVKEVTVLRCIQMGFISLIWPAGFLYSLFDKDAALYEVLDDIKLSANKDK